ncbi:MAG TPA: macro domain-containing protein [Gemmatimonadales bacterium]|nr:macro domain-containing protein [Gemmatimonadales bacterium]
MIRVLVDDLAFLAVDAVVRPADDRLEPVSTAAARLDAQAGPRFAAQRLVQQPLEVGAAVVTGAGDLAAGYVIHVVVQSAEQPLERATVRRALRSAWQRAMEWDLVRLAAPPVGAGAGQLGLEEAADLLVETFRAARPAARPAASAGPGRAPWAGELALVVEREAEREMVESVLRRAGLGGGPA